MRVISLYQPFATLMVLDLKVNETRSWHTYCRGPLLIHATAKVPTWCKELLTAPFFCRDLYKIDLPLGKIIGQVSIVRTHNTTEWVEAQIRKNLTGDAFERFQRELVYGDYSPNRYAWETEKPILFEEPIPARGSQGFWEFNMPAQPNTKADGQLSVFG